MINDTVREELETKTRKVDAATSTSGRLSQPKLPTLDARPIQDEFVPPVVDPMPMQRPAIDPAPPRPRVEPTPKASTPPPTPKPMGARFETADLKINKTSKTLVEFQTKKATIPEWRLQLQNSVRQKVDTDRRIDSNVDANAAKPRATNGANALKVEFVEDEKPRHQNPRVANALRRIEESRRTFTNQPVAEQPVNIGKAVPNRNYPFNVVAKSNEPPARPTGQKATVNASPKPMLVSPLKIEKRGYDTNKLPPLAKPGRISTSVEITVPESQTVADSTRDRWENLELETKITPELEEIETADTDEIEDLAPLSMRFNAGLFDMIIGVFGTLILLSPFMLSGGTWLSVSGFLAIAASVAIVMFLYLTISLAFVGRTVGMRLFSLELVDVDENAYPTLHQAAVSSAVFLLSIGLAGVGFLPIFFNEERRAAHDILSGTILIREI